MEDLGIEVPQSEAKRADIEKQNRFKASLDKRVTQMIVNGPNHNIPLFGDFIDQTMAQIMSDVPDRGEIPNEAELYQDYIEDEQFYDEEFLP